jgi:hypothetical protein
MWELSHPISSGKGCGRVDVQENMCIQTTWICAIDLFFSVLCHCSSVLTGEFRCETKYRLLCSIIIDDSDINTIYPMPPKYTICAISAIERVAC